MRRYSPLRIDDVYQCAKADYERWSDLVAESYDALIDQAVADIASVPLNLLNRPRSDLGAHIFIRPLSASKRREGPGAVIAKPSHYVVFRYQPGSDTIEFLRLIRGSGLVPAKFRSAIDDS